MLPVIVTSTGDGSSHRIANVFPPSPRVCMRFGVCVCVPFLFSTNIAWALQ